MPVYAAFDADDQCLYVGQSGRDHPLIRWIAHYQNRKLATWVDHAVRWEVLRDISERAATDRLKPINGDPRRADRRPAPTAGSSGNRQDETIMLIMADSEEEEEAMAASRAADAESERLEAAIWGNWEEDETPISLD